MNSQICIDANLIVKLYAFEDYSEQSVDLMDEADRAGIELIAPDFVFAETASALRKNINRGRMTAEDGALSLGLLKRLDIKRYDVRDLCETAWRIAESGSV